MTQTCGFQGAIANARPASNPQKRVVGTGAAPPNGDTPPALLATIETRETAIHDAIVAGSLTAFPDPLGPVLAAVPARPATS